MRILRDLGLGKPGLRGIHAEFSLRLAYVGVQGLRLVQFGMNEGGQKVARSFYLLRKASRQTLPRPGFEPETISLNQ